MLTASMGRTLHVPPPACASRDRRDPVVITPCSVDILRLRIDDAVVWPRLSPGVLRQPCPAETLHVHVDDVLSV
jgi:hypothetical protein